MMTLFQSKIDLSSFDESTAEGRLEKFNATCKVLRDWFFYGNPSPSIGIMLISKDDAKKNPYIDCIRKTTMVGSQIYGKTGWDPETGSKVSYEEAVLEVKSALADFSVLAMKFKKQRKESFMMFPLMEKDLRVALMMSLMLRGLQRLRSWLPRLVSQSLCCLIGIKLWIMCLQEMSLI